jgi:hypothetical protein
MSDVVGSECLFSQVRLQNVPEVSSLATLINNWWSS